MMLHAPVASVLLTCITSGLGVVRAIVQVTILFCSTRQQRKFHLMARASPDDNGDDDTVSQTSIHPISRGIGQSERDKNINNMSAAAESSTTTTTNTKNQVELTHLIK
ncbi:hypothetical protein BDC45DRAFT_517836 [Circinella umbellata]|nr:hypothetical protein BDC45DRAFT_517836 [Circinella umbellata]